MKKNCLFFSAVLPIPLFMSFQPEVKAAST